jgi:lysophospholipase L1-like esterase
MKKRLQLLVLAFTVFFSKNTFTQCSEDSQIRTILIGDSWAFFMAVDGTLDDMFERWGHSNLRFYTNTELSENGAKTTDFLKPEKKEAMLEAFQEYPEADHVHLSIGGNDFLRDWKMSFTEEEIETLKMEVIDNLTEIIDFIRDARPGIKILYSGYVYTNFEEEITRFLIPEEHPFYSTWKKMEYPDNASINAQSINFLDAVEQMAAQYDDVFFYNAPGLMQHHFGQTSSLQVPPYGTYQPGDAPMPFGFLDYPSPRASMRDYGLTRDCFHLSAGGYRAMVDYQMEKYYHKAFMRDTFFIAEPSNSGAVSIQGDVTNDLLIGNLNGNEYASVLEFNTLNNLDYTIDKASLFLRRMELTESNPITDTLLVEIRLGGFGASPALDADDFNAVAQAQGIPCVFGRNDGQHWVRLDLPESILPYISPNSKVQLRIKAPMGGNNGLMQFFGTENSAVAPVLDLVYGDTPASSFLITKDVNDLIHLYPNPSSGIVILEGGQLIEHVTVYNLLGELVMEIPVASTRLELNLSSFPSGSYIIQLRTGGKLITKKVIKN